MNHQKIYNQIIDRAKNRNLSEYTEKHHIVPKSLGGSDAKDNLVRLTPREHIIAHMLLVKIHKGTPAYYSMVQALIFMASPGSMPKGQLKSSRQYELLRKQVSELTRARNLQRSKDGTNPFAGEAGSKFAKERALRLQAEGKGINFNISVEDRRRNSKEFWAKMTPEQRSAHGKAISDSRTEENKKTTAIKSAKTRRENDEKLIQARQDRWIRINLLPYSSS